MKPKLILGGVFAGLFFIILLQNTQVVELRIFFWSLSMSRIILLPLIFIMGIVVGIIFGKLVIK